MAFSKVFLQALADMTEEERLQIVEFATGSMIRFGSVAVHCHASVGWARLRTLCGVSAQPEVCWAAGQAGQVGGAPHGRQH